MFNPVKQNILQHIGFICCPKSIGAELFRILVLGFYLLLKLQHGQHAPQLMILVHLRQRHIQQVLIFCQHAVCDLLLVMLHDRLHDQSKQKKHISELDPDQHHHIVCHILKNDPDPETGKEFYQRTQVNCPFIFLSAQVPSQKLKRTQLHLSVQNKEIDQKHQDNRNHCGGKESICIPYRFVGRQAIAVIIHSCTDLFHNRISKHIADQRTDHRNDTGHCHIMPHQFSPGIATGPESSDHIGFLFYGIDCGNRKNKGQNCDHHIKKDCDHCPVTAHILPGKADRLIFIPGNKVLQGYFLVDRFHQFLCCLLFFCF